jgi:hypothetical protein
MPQQLSLGDDAHRFTRQVEQQRESAKSAPAWATVMQLIDAMGVSLSDLAQAIQQARRRT